MKRKILLILVSIMFLLPHNVYAGSENSISWNEAVVKLDMHDNTLLDMARTEDQAKKQYDIAVKDSLTIETDGILIEFMDRKKFIQFDSYTQMLLTQQKELSPENMKLSWEAARTGRTVTRNSMIIGLRGLYLGLYSTDAGNKLEQRKIELAERIYQQEKIRHQRGLISDLDFIEAEYNLIKAKSARVASQRNYENALRSFNTYIGMDADITYDEISNDEEYSETRLKQPQYYVNRALSTRRDIVNVVKQISLFNKKKEIIERFPFSLKTKSVQQEYDDLIRNLEVQTLQLDLSKLEIEKEVRSAYVEVVAAGKNVVNMKKVLELQNKNLEKTDKHYEAGLISKNVLDQVQISYVDLENKYRALLFDYNTKLMKLEYAAGVGLSYEEGMI